MGHAEDSWANDPGYGLAEAQIAAIEEAFAERDRMLASLGREIAALRARPIEDEPTGDIARRLSAIEARLDDQDQALRHVVERLIAYFERGGDS